MVFSSSESHLRVLKLDLQIDRLTLTIPSSDVWVRFRNEPCCDLNLRSKVSLQLVRVQYVPEHPLPFKCPQVAVHNTITKDKLSKVAILVLEEVVVHIWRQIALRLVRPNIKQKL